MQDSAVTNSRGAFNIITMKSDMASLDKNISQAPTKIAVPSAPVFNKTEPPKAIPQQPSKPLGETKPKIPVQLRDSDFDYKKASIDTPPLKPKNTVDPDLIELSKNDSLDVPPPPPMFKPEKDTINLGTNIPSIPKPEKIEQKSTASLKDDFELQIENPFKEDQKTFQDISFSSKLEKEKDTIAKTFSHLAGEQNASLEKVVVGQGQSLPEKQNVPPMPKPQPKPEPLPEKPRPDTNPNDDLSIYDKHEIVNPTIIKDAKTEVNQAIVSEKKVEVKTFQAPASVRQPADYGEAKPEPPKDPIAEKLLAIEKEKEKIKEERKIIYADCKKDLTDIEIQKEKQNKVKFDLLGKIKDIKFNELEPLLNQEQNLEKQLVSIKEQEATASTIEQEEILFAKRSDIENQRQDTEKKRWQTEDKIQNLKIQIKDAENKIDELSEKERVVNAKREEFNNKVEKIEYQEKRWLLEKDLIALKSNLEKLSNEYANLIPEKDKLNTLLKDVLIAKTQLDKNIADLEIQEAKLPFEQKRDFEQKRQQKEKERQDKAKQAIESRKKKEVIEKRISELSSSIKEIEDKEKDIKTRIQTIEKALSGEIFA